MTRRHQQGKRAQKRAQVAAEQALASDEGAYRPPPRVECYESEWSRYPPEADYIRIRGFAWRKDGLLVDFVFLLEVADWANPVRWEPIARIDCCHGRCHLHPPGGEPAEYRMVQKLDTVEDVSRATALAMTHLNEVMRRIQGRS